MIDIGKSLTESDEVNILKPRWLNRQDAEPAGLRRVTSEEAAMITGRRLTAYEPLDGIAFPYWFNGVLADYRVRVDCPREEYTTDGTGDRKQTNRYFSPPGVRNRLYFSPTIDWQWLADIGIDVVLTEGEFKTLALQKLASWNYPGDKPRWLAVGTPGVWNFKGRTGKTTNANGARVNTFGPISDLELLAWTGRRVKIVFDSDVRTNPSVAAARFALALELTERGAVVQIVDVPEAA